MYVCMYVCMYVEGKKETKKDLRTNWAGPLSIVMAKI